MKRSLFPLLLLVAFSAFFTNVAVAALAPVPGIDVLVKKKGPECHYHGKPCPCATSIITGGDGTFDPRVDTGTYEISLSYDQVIKRVAAIDKRADLKTVSVMLSFEGAKDLMVNGRPYNGPIRITGNFRELTISTKNGDRLRCKITYEAAGNNMNADKKK